MEEMLLLLEKVKQGDKAARDKLAEDNLGLVHHVVKRFMHWGYDREELFQIGCIGLLKAIDKFDVSFQVRFSTYAVPMIQGEIKRFLRDDGMVKVSRTIRENSWKIQKIKRDYVEQYKREPTLLELAQLSQISMEDVIMALNAPMEVESLQKLVFRTQEQELCLEDQIIGDGQAGVGKAVSEGATRSEAGVYEDLEKEKLLNHLLLEQLLEELTEEEKQLIELRYYRNFTQTQVAKVMGLNQVKVSRMEKKILLNMRQKSGVI